MNNGSYGHLGAPRTGGGDVQFSQQQVMNGNRRLEVVLPMFDAAEESVFDFTEWEVDDLEVVKHEIEQELARRRERMIHMRRTLIYYRVREPPVLQEREQYLSANNALPRNARDQFPIPPVLRRQFGGEVNPRNGQIASSHGEITEGDDLAQVGRSVGLVQGCRYISSPQDTSPHNSTQHQPRSSSFVFRWNQIRPSVMVKVEEKATLAYGGGHVCFYLLRDKHCPLATACPYDHPPSFLIPKSVMENPHPYLPNPHVGFVGQHARYPARVACSHPVAPVSAVSTPPSPVTSSPSPSSPSSSSSDTTLITITPPFPNLYNGHMPPVVGIGSDEVVSKVGAVVDNKFVVRKRVEGLAPEYVPCELYSRYYNVLDVARGDKCLVGFGSDAWRAGFRSCEVVHLRQDIVEKQRLAVSGWDPRKKMFSGIQFNLGHDNEFLSIVDRDRLEEVEKYSTYIIQQARLLEIRNESRFLEPGDIPSGSLNWRGLPLYILAFFVSMMLRTFMRLSSLIISGSAQSTTMLDVLSSGATLQFILVLDVLLGIFAVIALSSAHTSGTMVSFIVALPILWEMRYIDFSMTRMVRMSVCLISVISLVCFGWRNGVIALVLKWIVEHPWSTLLTLMLVRRLSLTTRSHFVWQLGMKLLRGDVLAVYQILTVGNVVAPPSSQQT